jgi:hypothetical protein
MAIVEGPRNDCHRPMSHRDRAHWPPGAALATHPDRQRVAAGVGDHHVAVRVAVEVREDQVGWLVAGWEASDRAKAARLGAPEQQDLVAGAIQDLQGLLAVALHPAAESARVDPGRQGVLPRLAQGPVRAHLHAVQRAGCRHDERVFVGQHRRRRGAERKSKRRAWERDAGPGAGRGRCPRQEGRQ